MSRTDRQRLEDIVAACQAIAAHPRRGDATDDLVFDAIRIRLVEIGEAIKDIPNDVLSKEPAIPWRDIAGMRDHLAHRYFDTARSVVNETALHDIPGLLRAVNRILAAPGYGEEVEGE
jgi:uncharacterized protein with HEPN domain